VINIIENNKKYKYRNLFNSILFTILVICVLLVSRIFLDTPIQKLELVGLFQRVNPIQVEEIFSRALGKSFFSIEIRSLESDLESLDWVDNIEISRRWPNKISVRIYEQIPAAIWNKNSLLNERGEVFLGRVNNHFPELPNLFGPEGSEFKIANKYFEIKNLLEKSNVDLDFISMDERYSWLISFSSGPEIRIGRKEVNNRMNRLFNIVIPNLKEDFNRISYIDMRYTSGFSIGWKDIQEDRLASL
tara:strand:+ start:34043 stop:34780 length:738 start_codon:yes stop_codon:yes gene_type:complete